MAQNSVTTTLNTINSLTNPLIAKKISDNVTGKIPLFYLLNKVGHKEYENGGQDYRFPILQSLADAQAYTGATVLNAAERDDVTTAILYRKQFSTDVTLTGTNLLKNSGSDPTSVQNYILAQLEIAEEAMKNTLAGSSLGLFSSQADSDLGITGLQTMLSASASTGTYATLARANYSVWRQQLQTMGTGFSTDFNKIRILMLSCVRGEEAPSVFVLTESAYGHLERYLTSTLSYNLPLTQSTAFGDIGFDHINFRGALCIFDAGVPANRAFFLNFKYLKLLVHADRDMSIRDFIAPHTSDSITGRLFWAGNLVCNNLARQGTLTGLVDTYA